MKILQLYEGDDPAEAILEPELPLVDAHHHLWPNGSPIYDYEPDAFRKEIGTGHNVVATVFAECMAAYHQDGDEALRPVGEIEWVVKSCPITPDTPQIAAGLFGFADLRQPAIAARTLDALVEAGQGRFRGVRHNAYWHADKEKFTTGPRSFPRYLLLDPVFREGLEEVARRGLTYDVWMFSEQLPDLAATADAFPELTIILCHMGGPVTADHSEQGRRAVFDQWRKDLAEVARRPNVHLKVGGMGMHHFGFTYVPPPGRPTGEDVARLWQPYIDVAVNAFGPARCLAESNFPPDRNCYSYTASWNALKLVTRGYSASERADILAGTANRVYTLNLDLPN